MPRPIIAVDGPGSSGKGTVARGVAQALGFQYIDTGAMYRAVALVAERRGIAWGDEARLAGLASAMDFRFSWDGEHLRLAVDGEDVSDPIRSPRMGQAASEVSVWPSVRAALLERQRSLASEGGVVMDGRDIGTVVLPHADLKVYLDARLDERARRRHAELLQRGDGVTLDEVRDALAARDHLDATRATAPLRPADDAWILDSTDMPASGVVAAILARVDERGA